MGQESSVALSFGVGCRCGFDLALLQLWCRPAAAALIRPLAWEIPPICHTCGPKKINNELNGNEAFIGRTNGILWPKVAET